MGCGRPAWAFRNNRTHNTNQSYSSDHRDNHQLDWKGGTGGGSASFAAPADATRGVAASHIGTGSLKQLHLLCSGPSSSLGLAVPGFDGSLHPVQKNIMGASGVGRAKHGISVSSSCPSVLRPVYTSPLSSIPCGRVRVSLGSKISFRLNSETYDHGQKWGRRG